MFAATLIVTSTYFAYDIAASNRRLTAMERSTMESVFPVMQRIIQDAMVHKTRAQIRDLFLIANANGKGTAESMYLLDSHKQAIDLEDLAQGRVPKRFSPPETNGRSRLAVDFPMQAQPRCVQCHGPSKPILGYVRLVSPHAPLARAIAGQFEEHLAALSLMTLILGAWALILVRVMVERPLARITDAMTQVRAGQLDTRIAPVPESEFGRVSDGFNDMIEKIAEDRAEILDLHRRQVAHMEKLAAVGELAANLAHEIRNPLTGISSAIQVIRTDSSEGHSRRDVLDKILAQLSRMDQTMGNFLHFTRPPDANVRRYALNEALQRTLFLIEPRLKAQKVDLVHEAAGDLPRLVGDPNQIEQALLNLCLNAVQSMPSGGRLTVKAYRKDSEVRLEIADSGRGIPADQLDRIFQPFFTTREDGSGLGLPISRQIVLSHDGELWIESVPGRGTTAYIRLPIDRNGT